MVDQHAAHERIRVEKLFRKLCAAPSEQERFFLDVPVQLDVRLDDNEANDLERWGFSIGDGKVLSVPYFLRHKFGGEGGKKEKERQRFALNDFVEELLADLKDGFGTHKGSEKGSGWVGQMARCPKALKDLVNSKACRGAIMFNDLLEHNQAKNLIEDLSRTKFPFICAHGRPSIVPLVQEGGQRSTEKEIDIDWNRFRCLHIGSVV
ncbi:hypothetical protein BT69DRAFT_1289494 [Atractiella rhizophila]|nr:hypothetical protein BT69DRAFT_1289494 [Atractiella rhizophila]